MAGLWYRTGSVAVTQSSKKITGTGTSWQTALNRPSKGNVFYGPDGKAYEIDYISSETELYLVDVYTGANASSQSYKIDVRGGTVPELSRQLSEHYAYMQGIIDALQSIVSGSGDVTITGPSGQTVTVPALANMLSKSGNLAGLADKQAALGNLGLGNAAVRATQTSQIDTDTAHLMLAGAFGLGAIALPRVYDANTVLANGWYSYNRDAGDVEGPEQYGTILYTGHPGNGMAYPGWQTQLFFGISGTIYFRNNSAPNTFQGAAWKRVWTENVFSPQSGSFRPAVRVEGVGLMPDISSSGRWDKAFTNSKRVTVSGTAVVTDLTTFPQKFTVTLPFTASGAQGTPSAVASVLFVNATLKSWVAGIYGAVDPGETIMRLWVLDSSTGRKRHLLGTDFVSETNTAFVFTIEYEVA